MPFTIERNDLATMDVDAVVVTANEQLQITGGVGLTVANAAGFEQLQQACNEIGFCPTGSAVTTPGFGLSARMVIHVVGPVWRDGNQGEAQLLRSAYDSALEQAAAHNAASVALPLISAGTFGAPASVSLSIAREAIRSFLNEHEIDIHLVLFNRAAVAASLDAYIEIAEYIDDRYVEEQHRAASNLRRGRGRGRYGTEGRWHDVPRSEARALDKRALSSARIEDADYLRLDETVCESAEVTGSFKAVVAADDLGSLLENMDAGFTTTLLALIDARGMTDVEVYKRANISRQLFSRIRSDASYQPAKRTALALAIALHLSLAETSDLIGRAGYAFSPSSKSDLIVEYFIKRGMYDLFTINEALYAFDQPTL